MASEATKTGSELERRVADAYRQMGARKVEHDVELAGNQVDVYVELETSGGLQHRIAIEAKDWSKPVGIDVVNGFAFIAGLLRSRGLIDEGILVSSSGFSKQARNAAKEHGIRLLESADLEAIASPARAAEQTRSPTPIDPLPPIKLPSGSNIPLAPNRTDMVSNRFMSVLTLWRVFVASPSDVLAEREQLKTIVEELNEEVAHLQRVHIELLDWREKVVPLMGRPQDVILRQLRLEETDLLILILWHRFGTPPGGKDPRTGRSYQSGVEKEFIMAYRLWKDTGRPQISVYRCTRNVDPKQVDSEQLTKLQKFLTGFGAGGEHEGLVQEYKSVEDFSIRIRCDLAKLLYAFARQSANTTL